VKGKGRREVLLGNEAIGLGLLEAGCRVIAAYPGTPSSEILPAAVAYAKRWGLSLYAEWSTNEKVAFDQAFAAAMTGKRAACCMKQVGLNVACDSLMSAAYVGVVGGLVVISCDDPGPHSSQTEQDSRHMAWMAKIPVLDPATPREARVMARDALRLSERFQVPVMLRSVTRLSHARQDAPVSKVTWKEAPRAVFERNVARWAATPRFRFVLHQELNRKLERIRGCSEKATHLHFTPSRGSSRLGIIASGVPFQILNEIFMEADIRNVPLLKLDMVFPFPERTVSEFLGRCRRVLVLEEPDAVIEYMLPSRERVMGRLTGHVPLEGELYPEVVWAILDRAFGESGLKGLPAVETGGSTSVDRVMREVDPPRRRPTLCPGCPHRASFYAIRKAFPKAIFTSDIGCYTLGINLGGVDTILDMGAGITLASGLYQAFHQDGREQPIVATMGDSTFFHAGTAALINAVHNGARFVLLILDNLTTAMTGMQPTSATPIRVDGSPGKVVPLERVISGCGVDFLEVHDPYDVKGLIRLVRKAQDYAFSPAGGVAVIIARHPCVLAERRDAKEPPRRFLVTEKCGGCRHCIDAFECPALLWNAQEERASVDAALCAGCGVCIAVCPKRAIRELQVDGVVP
jgi:indolepyruvate ferredoxin oxidoreductase, alpha subunit